MTDHATAQPGKLSIIPFWCGFPGYATDCGCGNDFDLAKNVPFRMEDSDTFKDIMDRRIDLDLKKVYQSTGVACNPVVPLTSVAIAIKV